MIKKHRIKIVALLGLLLVSVAPVNATDKDTEETVKSSWQKFSPATLKKVEQYARDYKDYIYKTPT